MFTGIVRAEGTVTAVSARDGDLRLRVTSPELSWQSHAVGDSIAVNGVCLTAVAIAADGFECDVSAETLSVTTLGDLSEGSRVNLEPALAAGERFGGHIVSGHIDCVGMITDLENDGRSLRVSIELPAGWSRYVARKGSICVDGVSLTVNEVSGNRFDVNIIPHTQSATTFGALRRGSRVNIEVDLLARYLERLLQGADPPQSN